MTGDTEAAVRIRLRERLSLILQGSVNPLYLDNFCRQGLCWHGKLVVKKTLIEHGQSVQRASPFVQLHMRLSACMLRWFPRQFAAELRSRRSRSGSWHVHSLFAAG